MPRKTLVGEIMRREQTLIPVDMDQEDVALRFQKYALVSAAVVDDSGRLVGMITVDDIVHIISEEAGEDVLLLAGAGEGDINEPIRLTVRTRLMWLLVNLPPRCSPPRSSSCSMPRSPNSRSLRS